MALRDSEITVLGAGIAGLAVARALAMRGAAVTVIEQAPELAEVGAGLQISPNGMAVIEGLGLGAAVRAVSLGNRSVTLRDYRHGRRVVRLDQSAKAEDFRLIHRARLVEVLFDGARDAGVGFRFGRRHDAPPEAAMVIGADGLHSVVRRALIGTAAPAFTGQVAWRAVIAEDPAAPPEAQVFMGPGRHLVSYPMSGGLRNLVAVEERDRWTDEGWHHQDDPGALRAAFAGFGGPVPGWLAQVAQVFLWGLFRHPVAPRWHDGARLAILGDAAHPTLPFLAQGANMALEDAWVLAACLDRFAPPDAFAAYQAARHARCVRIVDAASRNARNFHLSGPVSRSLAHGGLRLAGLVAPGLLRGRFDWLYGRDVTAPGALGSQ